MFTYIRLQNFMSFKNVIFDFRKSKQPKNFIAIYGENGSGKSQFIKSIDLLRKSVDSLINLKKYDEMHNEISSIEKKKDNLSGEDFSKILELIKDELCNPNFFSKYRMVENNAPTIIEYGFKINNHNGYYIINFKDRLLYEKMYYFTGKQSGTIFEINYDNNNIKHNFSGLLFSNKKIQHEIEFEIEKYWGKHSFLAILNKEHFEKNKTFIKNNYLPYVFDIHKMLHNLSICMKNYTCDKASICLPSNVIQNIEQGQIPSNQKNMLDKTESLLNIFFTQAYADIKNVFYKKATSGKEISYQLFVKKMIAGKTRTLPFSEESAGTQSLAQVIQVLLGAFCGTIVVYDEIDNGIHDLLLSTVIESMNEYITGQVIITTHNTYLFENVEPKSVYLINVDYNGNKEIACLNEFNIQKSNSARKMYLEGLFGGIPFIDDIDYDEMSEILNNYDTKNIERGE